MTKPASHMLLISWLAYAAASTLHFVHNAVFLNSYPNMPDWISHGDVYAALAAVSAIGVLGCLLFLLHYRIVGLIVIGVYAVFGFDGLAHYTLAPISAHTMMMNLTIWLEVSTAAVLLAIVARSITTQISVIMPMSKT